MVSSLFIGCAIKGGATKGCSAKGCAVKGCCAKKTANNTELSEPKEPIAEPKEPVEPIEPAEGIITAMPVMPQLPDQSGTSEVGRMKTIMKFVGEGDVDKIFFSRVIAVENYKNGKKHGIWIYYKEDGSIDKQEEYRNGESVN